MVSISLLRGNHKIYILATLVLVYIMMVFPAQLYALKILCLLIMLMFVNKKLYLANSVKLLITIYLIYGLYGLLFGLLKNTEYPLSLITVAFIWPLLFIVFIGQRYTSTDLIKITQSLFFAHVSIILYDLIFCLGVIWGFSVPAIYPDDQIFSFYDTTSRLGFLNLNSITLTSPIIILIWMTGYNIKINRFIILIVILLTFFLLILCGRRSLMGLALAIIPTAYLFKSLFKKSYEKRIRLSFVKLIILLSILLLYVAITSSDVFLGYWETFTKAFDSDKEPIKFAQSQMLLKTFADNPLLGVGVGKELFEPSPGRLIFSYQYELQYLLVLAQTGIIGFILKMSFLLGILFYGLYIGKKYNNLLLIYCVGLTFMLIADFTNPVLCSFDFFLGVYIILGIINAIDLKRNSERVKTLHVTLNYEVL